MEFIQRGAVLTAADADLALQYGFSVSLNADGSILAVGSVLWPNLFNNQGAVYIYDWNGSSWVQRGSVLTAADALFGDIFGNSLSLSADGSILAVGASQRDGPADRQGGVYVYDWSGSAWVQRGDVITASDAAVDDYFGTSISLSSDGSILAVGAHLWEGTTSNQGGIYVYDWSGSAWVQRGDVLTASDAAVDDSFGYSLSLSADGSILAVGAVWWEGTATNQGTVYIYDWSGSAWVQRGAVLTASDAAVDDSFGASVGLSSDGSILAVGSVEWEGTTPNQGAVYIYDWSGSAWVQRGTVLTALDAESDDYYGMTVSLNSNGSILAVGAGAWEGEVSGQGGVYIYDIDQGLILMPADNVIVEVDASIGGVETTLYLSSRGYTTGSADTPANTNYLPVIAGGVQLTEELSLAGAGGLSYGDIEIYNLSGERDNWLDYVWANRSIKIYMGGLNWPRADYALIFDGVVADLDSKSRGRLNIKVRDKLQRLNSPVSDVKLGGSTSNADMIIPITLGEVSNITPLSTDPATHEYQYHDSNSEGLIEVRDNGVPISVTDHPTTGKFNLLAAPAGTITCSVQGDKPSGVYSNTIAKLIERIATGYGKAATRLTAGDLDSTNLADFETAHPQAIGVAVQSRENCISVIQALAASVGAQAVISRTGKLRLLQIALPPSGTPVEITAADMVQNSLHIVQRVDVRSSVKLGYCKNWTIQTGLQTGIPSAHMDLFAHEYLTVTESDAGVAAAYKLDAEPIQRDTLLLSTLDATAEATRELNLYKTPRTVFGFEGFSNLLTLELGQAVTITHPRFGLSSGKTGMVVKLQPDWINRRVLVEVLI